jgi:trehalose-6-phosphate synthase
MQLAAWSLPNALAMYKAADVLISVALSEGLNLTALEATAAQAVPARAAHGPVSPTAAPAPELLPHPLLPRAPAVIITSEFQPLSRALAGVGRVNPWSSSQLSAAMLSALRASDAERWEAHAARAQYASSHTLEEWAHGCLDQLQRAAARNRPEEPR